MKAGYWRAPRWLPELLERGEITPAEYALVNYAAQAGADRPQGMRRYTLAGLGALLGVGTKTASRALRNLAEQGLLEHDLKQGTRRPIHLRLGHRLADELRTGPQSPETEVVSEVTSDRDAANEQRNTASGGGLHGVATSDSSRAPRDRDLSDYVTSALTAYTGAGGSLDRAEWRTALERHAATQGRRDVRIEIVLAAAEQLGREREFPGYLSQRVAAIVEAGGVCQWHGMVRRGLTREQLLECGCKLCTDWARALPVTEMAA